jgi:3-hydroxybutyryl-CoA dehydrogenase
MGAGIAQVAARAGHDVWLHDSAAGASSAALRRIESSLRRQAERGVLSDAAASATLERIHIAGRLEDLSRCALVLEAIVEDLAAKQELLMLLEKILDPNALLVSNTSSISISALAAVLEQPARLVGMHFFNPPQVMRLVEVVSGISTDEDIARCVHATATAWGKVAVHTRSTPGFIVNRVARPYYAEALRLLEEHVADPETIDALLTEGAGFPMGPCALMDLVGHDVNYAVTRSLFEAFYQDPRYRPSLLQRELVDAGWLGSKSGRGLYDHRSDERRKVPESRPPADPQPAPLKDPVVGLPHTIGRAQVVRTDGRPAWKHEQVSGLPTIVYDLVEFGGIRLAFAVSSSVERWVADRFVSLAASQDVIALELIDYPGLVVMRTVAMIVNEALDAVHFGVTDEQGVDAAMRHGLNYRVGPIEWGRVIGFDQVLAVVDNLYELSHDPRYRASMRLRVMAGSS